MLTKSDLSQIQKVVQNEVEPVKKDIKSLKKNVRYIKKTVDVMVDLFDRRDIKLNKRVTRIEAHLGLANP